MTGRQPAGIGMAEAFFSVPCMDLKNSRRDIVTPHDSGDVSRGREAPMVITPRALVRLARQLAGAVHESFVRRAATRGRGKRAES
jgi:hypothetical protein